MNEMPKPVRPDRATQAAEGFPRWRWTTAELLRLTELGAFAAEDRFELIGGEIVPMSPVGRRHQIVREGLEDLLRAGLLRAEVKIVAEPQFNLAGDTYTEPDIIIGPSGVSSYDLVGDSALLVIEIAASSRSYDLGLKAALYARHGVREYWVVDAATLVTTVHRGPASEGYQYKTEVSPGDFLTPVLVPALSLRLSQLRLE